MTDPVGTDPVPQPFRVLPLVDETNAHVWQGGELGEFRLLRCRDDGTWIHPPSPRCPRCMGKHLRPEATSGRGTVHTFTVNHQLWYPTLDPPYVIAIVTLDEDETVRFTTNIYNCHPDDVFIGMAVRVVFDQYEDVFLPMFEPVDESLRERRSTPGPARGGITVTTIGERSTVISGVGQSQVGRRIYREPLDLTLDVFDAIDGAGLDRSDIDGIATYPGGMDQPPGFSSVSVEHVQDALRLDLNWFMGGRESPGQLGSVVNAIAAVATGLCRHVLCFRTVWEASAQGGAGRSSVTMGASSARKGGAPRFGDFMQWVLPFGAPSAANWIGMMAARHFHEYGTTREQLAQIALNGRRNTARNPNAIYTEPMTLDDYLDVRMVSTPLCLYDCDVPADGSTAIIVSHIDTMPDLRRPGLRVEAVGSALHGRPSWDQFDDLTTMALRDVSAMMWDRTNLTPADVDVAELYDGFSFITLCWLEALGFCGKGEGGAWLEVGEERIGATGELPLNTHGGQLSAGRLHGYRFLHEAATQLWGLGGERQVPGDPEVAIAAAGGGPLGSSLLLSRG